MLHVPDTGPGKRVTGAGARTDGREASRQSSEVGAVCRKAARTVLCGGRPVMGVPTAIPTLLGAFLDVATQLRPATDVETQTLSVPMRLHRFGREIRMLIDGANPFAITKPDARLIKLLIRAHRLNAALVCWAIFQYRNAADVALAGGHAAIAPNAA